MGISYCKFDSHRPYPVSLLVGGHLEKCEGPEGANNRDDPDRGVIVVHRGVCFDVLDSACRCQ